MIKNKFWAFLIAILMILPAVVSCGNNTDVPPVDTTIPDITTVIDEPDEPKEVSINGIPIAEYTVVYSASGLDFNKRAAEYIGKQIEELTGTAPSVVLDTESEDAGNEILVGITNRGADSINPEEYTDVFKFAYVSQGDSILLYGEEYMIAGAAYNLAKKLTDIREVTVSEEVNVGEPVFEDPKNIIYVIGDGMGFNSLKLGEELYESGSMKKNWETKSGYHQYSVADRLPNKGQTYTHSYDNDVTDSAAGGTALATGYKTYNGVIGLNSKLEPVKNLTELAQELGKKTAVITSDQKKGATPSAFSIHTMSREDSDEILSEYENVTFDYVIEEIFIKPENDLRMVLDDFNGAENGFFMMFEEAQIDKASHTATIPTFYRAYTRLNSALRVFFEYMMYNPDTVLVLTADHETGGITLNEETGKHEYSSNPGHTQVNVPLYGIGKGTEFFDGKTLDNTGVAKLIAQFMGVNDFGDPSIEQVTDKTGLETMSEEEIAAVEKEKAEAEKNYNANK
ncbi:MAG: alkaline phosphatase [Clostridia bacterium]|nr:alkaline phosphatase [Clostridia bacterium]